ncbi:MAG TPA: hypothetical protein PLU72_19785 [Candidatus Ozemobacteraceae bacterium]|nr:hypothetical protein [Candidatus Ozemobacteraceae bacterium]
MNHGEHKGQARSCCEVSEDTRGDFAAFVGKAHGRYGFGRRLELFNEIPVGVELHTVVVGLLVSIADDLPEGDYRAFPVFEMPANEVADLAVAQIGLIDGDEPPIWCSGNDSYKYRRRNRAFCLDKQVRMELGSRLRDHDLDFAFPVGFEIRSGFFDNVIRVEAEYRCETPEQVHSVVIPGEKLLDAPNAFRRIPVSESAREGAASVLLHSLPDQSSEPVEIRTHIDHLSVKIFTSLSIRYIIYTI